MSIVYYSLNPLQVWGKRHDIPDDSAGRFTTATPASSQASLPVTANVGQSGPLSTWPARYIDMDGNSYYYDFEESLSWQLLGSSSADTAWLCLLASEEDPEDPFRLESCIQTNASGEVLGYRIDAFSNQGQSSFR